MERKRNSIRMRNVDYGLGGSYFVTVNSHTRENIFGEVVEGESFLHAAGGLVQEIWNEIPTRFPGVQAGVHVVMPNHFHGIVHLGDPLRRKVSSPFRKKAVEARASLPKGSLGQVLAWFKYLSTREINRLRESPGNKIWHRNYYEVIIRNDEHLRSVEEYIRLNPKRWEDKSRLNTKS